MLVKQISPVGKIKKIMAFIGSIVILLILPICAYISYCLKVDYGYIPYPDYDDSVLYTFEDVVRDNLPVESCYQKYLDFYFDPTMDVFLHNNSRTPCRWNNDKVIFNDENGKISRIDSYKDSIVAVSEVGDIQTKILVKKEDGLTTNILYWEIGNEKLPRYVFSTNYLYDEKILKEVSYIDSTLDENIFPRKIFLKKIFESNDSSKKETYQSYFAEAVFLRLFYNDIGVPWKLYQGKVRPVEGTLEWRETKKEDLFFACDNYVNCQKISSIYEKHDCSNPFVSFCESEDRKGRKVSRRSLRSNKFFKQTIFRQSLDSMLVFERYEIEEKGIWRHKRIVEITYDPTTHLPLLREYKGKMSLLGLIDFDVDKMKETISYQKGLFQRKEMFQDDLLIKSVIFNIDSINRYTDINVYGQNGNTIERINIEYH